MIRTRDLEGFIDSLIKGSDYYDEVFEELGAEIVARLRELDKLRREHKSGQE